ncbi:glycosyltransferase family 4 protein [Thiorhodococcus minor]|uniref:Glycosyltransferase family 4 protein n=1 Tax=Thiorhodococcus minor TaxID=57489 RepID=A0A6M0JZV5_9GAMM|nr:glycosyltransferase family 4 protein [Thiorhodococcus minor]NEV63012.1 glycosyltransferase family 4 protein [Thiorhodococcus minor]
MRILTVSHFFDDHGGGIERVAAHLSEEFHALGHASIWAAASRDQTPPTNGVTRISLPYFDPLEKASGLPMPIPSLTGLRRLLRAVRDVDQIVIHDALYVTSIVTLVAAKWMRKPVLLIQHIGDILFPSQFLRTLIALANRLVTHNMLRAVDRVVYISATTQEAFSGVKTRHPSRVIYNGVDTAVFNRKRRAERDDIRTSLGVNEDRRLVLFVGRFVTKKGLEIIERLARQRSDLEFILAGSGVIEPETWRLHNVRVVRNRTGRSLAELYCAANLLLLPSVGEGYPLVIQEAMACGLPVICGEASANADPDASRWLIGVPISLADISTTACRISHAIDNMHFSQQDASQLATYARERYQWSSTAHQILAEIHDR